MLTLLLTPSSNGSVTSPNIEVMQKLFLPPPSNAKVTSHTIALSTPYISHQNLILMLLFTSSSNASVTPHVIL